MATFWSRVFQSFVSLEELHLVGISSKPVVEVLGLSGQDLTCPKLKTLTIFDEPELPFTEIAACLAERVRAGVPLQRLVLQSSEVDSEGSIWLRRMNQVNQHVGSLEVMGYLHPPPTMGTPSEFGAARHRYWPAWKDAPI